MPIIASDAGGNFTPAPEGLHQAVCVDVVDRGMVETTFGTKHQVQIRWELELMNDESMKPFMVVQTYTLSLNQKAKLRQHVEAWRGRKFTAEELKGFDLEKLIGVNCQLQIVHNISSNGTTYGNVQAIVPLGKGMTKIRGSEDYVRAKDRDSNGDPASATAEVADDDEAPLPF